MTTDNIKAWPKPTGVPLEPPARIHRPCDAGLHLTVMELESQLGTIEAYNRLVEAAHRLMFKIKMGEAKAQNPIFAKSPTGAVD
jgi:hypothetical protein